jgi:F-type H+-transporting ATPase subunit b
MEELLGQFSLGLFIIQSVLFVLLVLLLKKFAWGPILDAVNEREETIENSLNAANKAKAEISMLKADNERLLAEAREERDNILKAAREAKEQIIGEAKVKANEEADKILVQAKAAIQTEKNIAIADIKNQVAKLSVEIAEKLLKEKLSNSDAQESLVAKYLDEVKLN